MLDHALSYKVHMEKMKGKIRAWNNILRMLANSKWGSNLAKLQLYFAIQWPNVYVQGWERSVHAKMVDPVLIDSCCYITNRHEHPLCAGQNCTTRYQEIGHKQNAMIKTDQRYQISITWPHHSTELPDIMEKLPSCKGTA